MGLILTQHAKERYAERIMEREEKPDIMVFIAQNEEKIQRDIEKMVEFGELLYSGPTFKDNQIVNVYLNGLWIVILSSDHKTVVTLYPVDLGISEELNKTFVEAASKKIRELNEEYEVTKKEIDNIIKDHQQLIKDNEDIINENKKIIKCLEEQNESYKSYIKSQSTKLTLALTDIRTIITKLIGKNRFEV